MPGSDDLTGVGQARVASDRSWTTDTLLVHFKALLDAERSHTNQAVEAAVLRADAAVEAALVRGNERDLRYQQRFEAQTQAITQAIESAALAVSKAEAANERRFASVNEFRQTLTDQAATFMPRAEYEAQTRADRDRLTEITRRIDRAEGKTSGFDAGWGYLLGAIGAAGAIIAIVISVTSG